VSVIETKGRELFLAGAVWLLPILVYYIYSPGLSAGFYFDDYHNLVGLADVTDISSAVAYVMEPKGGPLGRPLAMASFLLNAPSWEWASEDFLHTNICIHLLNGMLLLWCCLRAASMVASDKLQADLFAFSVAALWLMQPLLASANLMVVQRMTTLAVTFGLVGTLIFIVGMQLLRTSVRSGYLLMSTGVVTGTVLGMFAKENGVLLPLMLMIMQGTVLQQYVRALGPAYRRWRLVFLIFPSMLVFGYLLYLIPALPGGYAAREFSLVERLMTEARIVLRYLGLILLPTRSAMGPFQDDFPLSHGLLDPPETMVSIFVIFLLTGLGVVLRKKTPVLSFAILWFFAGHLLESTIIPLETYFEHRNYFPAIGPLVAIVYLGLSRRENTWIGPLVLTFYGVLVGWVCFSVTSVFGDKMQSAILWSREHPDSLRAVQNLSLAYSLRGDFRTAFDAISAFSERRPKDVGTAIQSLQLACVTGKGAVTLQAIKQRGVLQSGKLNAVICNSVEKIAKSTMDDACPGVLNEDVLWISRQILSNHNIGQAREVSYCLNDIQAMIYFNDRDFEATMEHVEAAFSFRSYWPVAERLIELPISAGRSDLARENIVKVRARIPKNIFQASVWEANIRKYELLIDEMEKRESHGR
jgi:protein O-mannosyl-transferase